MLGRTGYGALLIIAGLLASAAPALADPRDISVGGIFITRITADSSGYTSYQRAVEVNKRITEILSTPSFRSGGAVAVRQDGQSATITVGNILAFTVTPQDTAGTTVTTMQLAHQWAQLLAEGLSKALPDSTFHF
jgi:hypothetical protein